MSLEKLLKKGAQPVGGVLYLNHVAVGSYTADGFVVNDAGGAALGIGPAEIEEVFVVIDPAPTPAEGPVIDPAPTPAPKTRKPRAQTPAPEPELPVEPAADPVPSDVPADPLSELDALGI